MGGINETSQNSR